MGVIDPNVFYRAGRARQMKPRSGASYRADTMNKILGFVGKIALNRMLNTQNELDEIRKKSNNTKADTNTLINDVGASLNPKFKMALTQWDKDYYEGIKQSKYGLTKKKRDQGREMAELAYAKMQNLHGRFQDISAKVAKYEKQALLYNNEPVGDYAGMGWNSGDSEDAILNGAQLANGKLFQHMDVDLNTGQIYVLRERPNEDGEVITVPVPYTDILWPSDEDNTLQGVNKGYIEEAMKRGDKLREWDEMWGQHQYDEISASINNSSFNAKRSFYFGGVANYYSDGKLTSSSPAYIHLKSQGFIEGTPEWQGAMTTLKEELKFREGSPESKQMIDLIYNAAQGYHNNSFSNAETRRNKKTTKGGGGGGGKEKETKSTSGTFKGATLSYGYRTKQQMEGQIRKIEREDPQIKSLDGITWNWNADTKKYETEGEDGVVSYTKRQLLEHNEITDFYPDKFIETKKDVQEEAATEEPVTGVDANEEFRKKHDKFRNTSRGEVVPKKYAVTINNTVLDIRKLNQKQIDQLSNEDRLRWLSAAVE
jgi:hypothetical protein